MQMICSGSHFLFPFLPKTYVSYVTKAEHSDFDYVTGGIGLRRYVILHSHVKPHKSKSGGWAIRPLPTSS